MNIKPAVLICGALIIFSCNSKTGTKKENYNKDDNTTIVVPENQDNNAAIKYLADSKDITALLCQGWEMEDDVNELRTTDDDSKLVIPVRSFYISTDGSFTKNVRNAMDYGKWKYDDAEKTITFYYTNIKGKDVYKIVAIAADELKLMNKQLNTNTILKFISSAKVNKDPLQEPFHISNNRWRIKPTAPETDAALHARLKDNLHFFILYYKDAIAKNPDLVSFYGLPSCLRWYSGGIFMKKVEELNPEWLKCFYNDDEAMKAYNIMDKVMDKKYTWPKDNSGWLQQNLVVLQQIYNNVDSL